jgi:hypothetical protein
MTDVPAQWNGQQRNNPLAQVVKFACPRSQVGNRGTL